MAKADTPKKEKKAPTEETEAEEPTESGGNDSEGRDVTATETRP